MAIYKGNTEITDVSVTERWSSSPEPLFKVRLGTTQIWPELANTYHMEWDFTNGSAPSGRTAEGATFTSKGAKASGNVGVFTLSLPVAAIKSLKSAQYIEIFANYYGESSDSQIRVNFEKNGELVPKMGFQKITGNSSGEDTYYRFADTTGGVYIGFRDEPQNYCSMVAIDLIHTAPNHQSTYRACYFKDGDYVDYPMAVCTEAADIRRGDTFEIRVTGDAYIKSLEFLVVSRDPDMPAGAYRNESMGVISLSNNGYSWVSIADKNLGASRMWTAGTTPTDSNAGYFYQRGNNYGHSHSGLDNVTEKLIGYAGDIPDHGPGNYFRYPAFSGQNRTRWSKEYNSNLWGGDTGTNAAMRGPCDSGWHIPSFKDACRFLFATSGLGVTFDTLGMPAGYWNYSGDYIQGVKYYWISEGYGTSYSDGEYNYHYASLIDNGFYDMGGNVTSRYTSNACHIRPFANATYFPNETYWTVLYQPS